MSASDYAAWWGPIRRPEPEPLEPLEVVLSADLSSWNEATSGLATWLAESSVRVCVFGKDQWSYGLMPTAVPWWRRTVRWLTDWLHTGRS